MRGLEDVNESAAIAQGVLNDWKGFALSLKTGMPSCASFMYVVESIMCSSIPTMCLGYLIFCVVLNIGPALGLVLRYIGYLHCACSLGHMEAALSLLFCNEWWDIVSAAESDKS